MGLTDYVSRWNDFYGFQLENSPYIYKERKQFLDNNLTVTKDAKIYNRNEFHFFNVT